MKIVVMKTVDASKETKTNELRQQEQKLATRSEFWRFPQNQNNSEKLNIWRFGRCVCVWVRALRSFAIERRERSVVCFLVLLLPYYRRIDGARQSFRWIYGWACGKQCEWKSRTVATKWSMNFRTAILVLFFLIFSFVNAWNVRNINFGPKQFAFICGLDALKRECAHVLADNECSERVQKRQLRPNLTVWVSWVRHTSSCRLSH